ncbi:unnamed protein product [Ranitomeya imitator]|uniref:Transmembrane 9 superfamily member n=1 Tax=Ranitomeya imitator TaxID=111125 RepID=A0ABN9LNZ9_9NEOB|nr:unnamed protein product [Ranitomeya imitator]
MAAQSGRRLRVPAALVLLLCTGWGSAFYLPGLAPVSFCEKDKETESCKSQIELFVNRLDSVESVLPYEYDAFDFCKEEHEKHPSENLGQVLFGERIASSPYKFTFNKNETCKEVCRKEYDRNINTTILQFIRKGIQLNYQHHCHLPRQQYRRMSPRPIRGQETKRLNTPPLPATTSVFFICPMGHYEVSESAAVASDGERCSLHGDKVPAPKKDKLPSRKCGVCASKLPSTHKKKLCQPCTDEVLRNEQPSLLDSIRTLIRQEVQSSMAALSQAPTPQPPPPKKRKMASVDSDSARSVPRAPLIQDESSILGGHLHPPAISGHELIRKWLLHRTGVLSAEHSAIPDGGLRISEHYQYALVLKAHDQYALVLKEHDQYALVLKARDQYHLVLRAHDQYALVVKAHDQYGLVLKAHDQYAPVLKAHDQYALVLKAHDQYVLDFKGLTPDNLPCPPGDLNSGDVQRHIFLASDHPPLYHHYLADDARKRTIPLHVPVKRRMDRGFQPIQQWKRCPGQSRSKESWFQKGGNENK